jgi:hypothetical protein
MQYHNLHHTYFSLSKFPIVSHLFPLETDNKAGNHLHINFNIAVYKRSLWNFSCDIVTHILYCDRHFIFIGTIELLSISLKILIILPTGQIKFLGVSIVSDSQDELKKSVCCVSLKSFKLPVLLPYCTYTNYLVIKKAITLELPVFVQ